MPLFYAAQYDESIQQARKVLEMDPNYVLAMNVIAWNYMKEHKYGDAVDELKQATSVPGAGHSLNGSLTALYAAVGQTVMARKSLARLEDESERLHTEGLWIAIASAHAVLGDRDEAFDWLEKAVRARDGALTLIERVPFLDSLHSDPRFARLVRRIGLPTYHFVFKDTEERRATVTIRDQKLEVSEAHSGKADIVVAADSQTWLGFLAKERNLIWALLRRQIRIKGSPKLLLVFRKCFPS